MDNVVLRVCDRAGFDLFARGRSSDSYTPQGAAEAADANSLEPNLPDLGIGRENRPALIIVSAGRSNVGFLAGFVGSLSGNLTQPDNGLPLEFSALETICRVCRVL